MTTTQTATRPAVATSLDVLRERREAFRGRRERRYQSQSIIVPAGRATARAQFEFRANADSASGPTFYFEGYAATFEQPFEMWDFWGDPYFETLAETSCNRTLANQCDTQFLVGHDETGLPMARTKSGTLTLTADSTGLLAVAPALDGRNPQVQQLASAMGRGDVDEMSIGFLAVAQQWSPDWMERRITEINLNRGDVSVVCWAANPNANGATGSWSTTVPEAAARAAGNREAAAAATAGTEQRAAGDEGVTGEADDGYASGAPEYNAAEHGPGSTVCPDCGAGNGLDAKFCDQCGAGLYDNDNLIEDPLAFSRQARVRVLALKR